MRVRIMVLIKMPQSLNNIELDQLQYKLVCDNNNTV